MRLKPEQLARHVGKAPAPVYVLSGDEPLQMQDARDAILSGTREHGFEERVLLHVDARFDWSVFREHAASLSLFSSRRVIDLRMPSGAPGKDGGKVLREYAENPNPDNLLLVSTGFLDRRTQSSAWFKALDKAGAHVAIRSVERGALPGWVRARAQALGVSIAPDAAEVLAERSEGNLLACVQELEKLRMLHGDAGVPLDAATVLDAVTDSARFGAFDLLDAGLAGDAARAARIVRALREEGIEPMAVLGSLAWGIRGAAGIALAVADGKPFDQAVYGAWWPRKALLARALQRHDPNAWARLLGLAGEVDRRAKGMLDGGVRFRPREAWDTLEGLALAIGGVRVLDAPPYDRLTAPGGRA